MSYSRFRAYFILRHVLLFSGSFLKAARRVGVEWIRAFPPCALSFCFYVSLAHYDVEWKYRRQSPRPPSIISLMHVVFSRLLPLIPPDSLVPLPSYHSSLSLILGLSQPLSFSLSFSSTLFPSRSLLHSFCDPFRRETRLNPSYFPRASHPVPSQPVYSSCCVFVVCAPPSRSRSHFPRALLEAFAGGKYVPGERRRGRPTAFSRR